MPIEKGSHKGERGHWSEKHQDWVCWDFIGRRLVSVSDWPRIRDAYLAWWEGRYANLPPVPMIVSDYLGSDVNGLWHPNTGKRTDSKSHFRKMTRDTGGVEIGDESIAAPRRTIDSPAETKARQADIARAMQQLGI